MIVASGCSKKEGAPKPAAEAVQTPEVEKKAEDAEPEEAAGPSETPPPGKGSRSINILSNYSLSCLGNKYHNSEPVPRSRGADRCACQNRPWFLRSPCPGSTLHMAKGSVYACLALLWQVPAYLFISETRH